jgi:hypothetical protein
MYGEAWVGCRHCRMVERDRGRASVDDKTAKGATCGAGVAGVAGVDCVSCPLMSTGCVACSPAGMCGLLARGDVWPARPR